MDQLRYIMAHGMPANVSELYADNLGSGWHCNDSVRFRASDQEAEVRWEVTVSYLLFR